MFKYWPQISFSSRPIQYLTKDIFLFVQPSSGLRYIDIQNAPHCVRGYYYSTTLRQCSVHRFMVITYLLKLHFTNNQSIPCDYHRPSKQLRTRILKGFNNNNHGWNPWQKQRKHNADHKTPQTLRPFSVYSTKYLSPSPSAEFLPPNSFFSTCASAAGIEVVWSWWECRLWPWVEATRGSPRSMLPQRASPTIGIWTYSPISRPRKTHLLYP